VRGPTSKGRGRATKGGERWGRERGGKGGGGGRGGKGPCFCVTPHEIESKIKLWDKGDDDTVAFHQIGLLRNEKSR